MKPREAYTVYGNLPALAPAHTLDTGHLAELSEAMWQDEAHPMYQLAAADCDLDRARGLALQDDPYAAWSAGRNEVAATAVQRMVAVVDGLPARQATLPSLSQSHSFGMHLQRSYAPYHMSGDRLLHWTRKTAFQDTAYRRLQPLLRQVNEATETAKASEASATQPDYKRLQQLRGQLITLQLFNRLQWLHHDDDWTAVPSNVRQSCIDITQQALGDTSDAPTTLPHRNQHDLQLVLRDQRFVPIRVRATPAPTDGVPPYERLKATHKDVLIFSLMDGDDPELQSGLVRAMRTELHNGRAHGQDFNRLRRTTYRLLNNLGKVQLSGESIYRPDSLFTHRSDHAINRLRRLWVPYGQSPHLSEAEQAVSSTEGLHAKPRQR
jgi:hypothetical protein